MKLGSLIAAIEALVKLLKDAQEVKRLYDQAGEEYPEPLARLLNEPKPKKTKFTIVPNHDYQI